MGNNFYRWFAIGVCLFALGFSLIAFFTVEVFADGEAVSSETVSEENIDASSDTSFEGSDSSSEALESIEDNLPEEPVFYAYEPLSVDNPRLFTNCYYVDVTISDAYLSGQYTLYIPTDQAQYLGLNSSSQLVNLSFDTIQAFIRTDDENVPYNQRINFSTFGTGTYTRRYYDSYDRWRTETRDITCTLIDTNISGLKMDDVKPVFSISDYLPYIILLVGGVIVICFMKRSRSS